MENGITKENAIGTYVKKHGYPGIIKDVNMWPMVTVKIQGDSTPCYADVEFLKVITESEFYKC